MNKHELHEIEKKLYALDFAATDLHLYLNTHPNDRAALAEYNKVIALAKVVRAEYEEYLGPLYSFRSPSSADEWSWLSEYSPWEREFNWSFEKGDGQ